MGSTQNKQDNKQKSMNDSVSTNVKEKAIHAIPQNAKIIIIVLGQCLLPTGKPHPRLIGRVNKAYSLFKQDKLDIDSTYFIVSGSDVSNFIYQQQNNGQLPEPRHTSEAQMMYNLMMDIHKKQLEENKDNDDEDSVDNFVQHILLEDEAMTTTQNFLTYLK